MCVAIKLIILMLTTMIQLINYLNIIINVLFNFLFVSICFQITLLSKGNTFHNYNDNINLIIKISLLIYFI